MVAIELPVAWYIMANRWLENFAYRIEISAWIILISGAAPLCTAWLSVSYQSIRAASKNPVNSLNPDYALEKMPRPSGRGTNDNKLIRALAQYNFG